MKQKFISVLKVVIPLGIGIFVIWYQFSQLTDEQLQEIKQSFEQANYFWVATSVLLGLMSHVSRAWRWKYTLEPLGFTTRFYNNFFAVMIGYVANIVLPRLGEVWRCVMLSRFENTTFEKTFGTVVAERVADMVILAAIVVLVVIMQLSMLKESIESLLSGYMENNSMNELAMKIVVAMLVVGIGSSALWWLIKKSTNAFFVKMRSLIQGLFDGIMSILRMDRKWAFLFHTLFIWAMYVGMYYVPFLALPETADASIGAVLASFVMASFSIVLVQGGIGVYPVAVAQTLIVYGIPYESGFAMGWIIWVAQTIMIVLFGVVSLVLMPMVNSAKSIQST